MIVMDNVTVMVVMDVTYMAVMQEGVMEFAVHKLVVHVM